MTGIYAETVPKAKARIRKRSVGVCVVGLGTVGLAVAVHLAHAGFRVRGLDVSKERVESIRDGSVPFEFPSLLREAGKRGMLTPSLDPAETLQGSEVVFVCVPTRLRPDNTMDTTALDGAARSISENMSRGALVLVESTVAVGSCRRLAENLEQASCLKAGADFGLAHCPERYNPTLPSEPLPVVSYGRRKPFSGQEYLTINRVIGGLDAKSVALGQAVYGQYMVGSITPLSSIEAAEATKLFENIFRDVNIALVNEVAQICERAGVNVHEVIRGASTKPFAFLPHYPGPGVGGECIPVVPWFLIKQAEGLGLPAKVMASAREVNDSMPGHMLSLLDDALQAAGRELSGSRVTILGVAYKKNIDDTRFSPGLSLAKLLVSRECEVKVCDPVVHPGHLEMNLVPLDRCFEGSDGAVLVTDHDSFSKVDFAKAGKVMRTRVVVDGRGFFDGARLRKLGFSYTCVGVPNQ